MSNDCRDCRAGLAHCHGTVIRHSSGRPWGRWECTEPDCACPELIAHAFVIDCDAVGCDCHAESARIAV
jgi:hypothetical protein